MAHHFADAHWESHEFLEAPYVRVPKEIACSFAASAVASPLVAIMDKAMVRPITGIGPLLSGIGEAGKEMIVKPKSFFGGLPFRLTFLVYFGTYAAANVSEVALDYYNERQEENRKKVKVAAASAANVSLLQWRDSVFAREYSGAGNSARKIPLRTMSLFAVRDSFTMLATFYGAPKAAAYLIKEHDVNHGAAELSTALFVPVIAQFVTAPLHIHAMQFFNNPLSSFSESMGQIKTEYSKVAFGRGLRILPAFGLGSYCNNKFRELTIRQPNEDLLLTRKVTKLIARVTRPPPRRAVSRDSPN